MFLPSRVTRERRSAKKLTHLVRDSLFASHTQKITPVLQAKIKQHNDDSGPLENIPKSKNIKNSRRDWQKVVLWTSQRVQTCLKQLHILGKFQVWKWAFTWHVFNTFVESLRIKATTGTCCWTVLFVEYRNNCQSPLQLHSCKATCDLQVLLWL